MTGGAVGRHYRTSYSGAVGADDMAVALADDALDRPGRRRADLWEVPTEGRVARALGPRRDFLNSSTGAGRTSSLDTAAFHLP